MAVHRPLVLINGVHHQLPQGDTVVGLASVESVPSVVLAAGEKKALDGLTVGVFVAVEWLVTAWTATARRTVSIRAQGRSGEVRFVTYGGLGDSLPLVLTAEWLAPSELVLYGNNRAGVTIEAGAVRQYVRV